MSNRSGSGNRSSVQSILLFWSTLNLSGGADRSALLRLVWGLLPIYIWETTSLKMVKLCVFLFLSVIDTLAASLSLSRIGAHPLQPGLSVFFSLYSHSLTMSDAHPLQANLSLFFSLRCLSFPSLLLDCHSIFRSLSMQYSFCMN